MQLISEIESLERHITHQYYESEIVEFDAIPDETTILSQNDEAQSPSLSEQTWIPVESELAKNPPISIMSSQETQMPQHISDKKKRFSLQFPTRNEPIRNVFTLRLNEGGELVGFDLKKPHTPREKFSFKTLLKRKSSSEGVQAEMESSKGIKGKVLGILGRFRKKGTNEKSESKISGVLTRIKGVFSRS